MFSHNDEIDIDQRDATPDDGRRWFTIKHHEVRYKPGWGETGFGCDCDPHTDDCEHISIARRFGRFLKSL